MTEQDTLPAPLVNLSPPPKSKWQFERQAFLQLLPQLLQTHRGKYVAIHEGRVVETGDDLVDVAMLAYADCGHVPVYVDLVAEQPPPPVRNPHWRPFRTS